VVPEPSVCLEDDVRFESVILVEQQSAAEVRAQARAEAQEAAAQARAEAQAAAAEARAAAARIQEQVQRDVQEQIREQVQQRIHVEQGQGPDIVVGRGFPPPWERDDIPPRVVDVITMFLVAMVICIVGLPIARAVGRWIDRRGAPAPVSAELAAQMTRIEQAVDTMSVEVERISEAQRFQAKLLSDREKVRA
jgi:multidrug efflux pump subunit AcrA (membrane-fusion protein)